MQEKIKYAIKKFNNWEFFELMKFIRSISFLAYGPVDFSRKIKYALENGDDSLTWIQIYWTWSKWWHFAAFTKSTFLQSDVFISVFSLFFFGGENFAFPFLFHMVFFSLKFKNSYGEKGNMNWVFWLELPIWFCFKNLLEMNMGCDIAPSIWMYFLSVLHPFSFYFFSYS